MKDQYVLRYNRDNDSVYVSRGNRQPPQRPKGYKDKPNNDAFAIIDRDHGGKVIGLEIVRPRACSRCGLGAEYSEDEFLKPFLEIVELWIAHECVDEIWIEL